MSTVQPRRRTAGALQFGREPDVKTRKAKTFAVESGGV